MKTDKQITLDVIDSLKFDPRISEQQIAVAVKDGIVTLKGEVESVAQKLAAEEVIKAIMGVRGFIENLEVNPPTSHRRSDQDIAQAALTALKWNAVVPADKTQVKVENGWVTLLGEVHWHYEREAAQTSVSHLSGVRGVSNKIVVKPFMMPSDVQAKIIKAFERGAQREAQNILIKVAGGVITLEGSVPNWADYAAAERAAWSVSGVTDVNNLLLVDAHALVR